MFLPGAIAYGLARYGEGNGSILLDNVDCNGDEENLDNCQFDQIHNCVHSEDASVMCSIPTLLPGTIIRLNIFS